MGPQRRPAYALWKHRQVHRRDKGTILDSEGFFIDIIRPNGQVHCGDLSAFTGDTIVRRVFEPDVCIASVLHRLQDDDRILNA